MERASTKALREQVRSAGTDLKKRREICEDFLFQSDLTDYDETQCSRCGKEFELGERRLHFQGSAGDLCDTCFCDEMEAMAYQENGLDFVADVGGGTIWVTVDGEEPILSVR